MRRARPSAPVRALLGTSLLLLLVLPALRHALESSMTAHMLVQYPALMLAGALLGSALRGLPVEPVAALLGRLSGWNALGISGLLACALVLALAMVPRVLDLALVDLRVESAKVVALVLAGAVLRPSWGAAGWAVQAFFLGNVVPMTIIVGTLYRESTQRYCNAYRLEDQQQLGLVLVGLASLASLVWLTQLIRRVS